MPKITPCLWFDGRAEDAAAFYTSLLPTARSTRSSGRQRTIPACAKARC